MDKTCRADACRGDHTPGMSPELLCPPVAGKGLGAAAWREGEVSGPV